MFSRSEVYGGNYTKKMYSVRKIVLQDLLWYRLYIPDEDM